MVELRADLGDRDNPSPLYRIRHSLAHVMAEAVLELRPGSTRGFGPPIDSGFYYDFVLTEPITERDFPEIERRMRRIIRRNQSFVHEELPVDRALARLEEMGEPYKAEYARELAERYGLETLGFYTSGSFVDMCEGPHVERTGELPEHGFRLRSVAGAYWRGDERNAMMTRIYAWAFESRDELEAAVRRYEEALQRDHKRLGAQLDLFAIDPLVGKGLPLWLPHGTVIRDELERLAREEEFKEDYQRVATPHLARAELFRMSGHLPYYEPDMFPPMVVEDRPAAEDDEDDADRSFAKDIYYLKPMNCPLHHRIFASRKRSYRELPLRLTEYGQVYRFEDHGALSGLLRVRGMCMNDAHIYCTRDQIQDEFIRVMRMHERYFELFGITGYHMRLSLWDPDDAKGREKYVDDPDAWRDTEDQIRNAMRESGLPFVEARGEAAFYGPKIDVQLRTVTGREESVATNQLDFAVPRSMNLRYTGPDGEEHRPFCIHRAPLSTHERFVAYLIEHFGGAFPTWLAPVQVRVLPISERFVEYAERLCGDLRARLVRAEVDRSDEKLGKKVREAITRKIPVALVVGEAEQAAGTVTVRRYGEREQQTVPFAQFTAELADEIRTRALRRPPQD